MAVSTRNEVRQVLLITLVLNLLVAFSKIGIGTLTGALAILADGFHSLVDGSSNVVALVANRLAARPPDADHPYGHRRYETVAALGIGAFLLVVAWEIFSSALGRLMGESSEPTLTPLSFIIMLVTLLVNIGITTYESRAGRRLQSELLTADAAHTRTDVFVSLSVLASMALQVAFGWAWVDLVAAGVIVILIVRVAWGVLSQAGGVLVDTAPYTPEALTRWAEALPAVDRVVRARSRGPLDSTHVDLDVQVDPYATADQTEAIAGAIRAEMAQRIPGLVEVEVHFIPAEKQVSDPMQVARARADALGLSTHEVRLVDSTQGRLLELHVEVPPSQTLAEAHTSVTQLEQEIRTALPEVSEVLTHIEPRQIEPAGIDDESFPEMARELAERALVRLQTVYPDANWHHLHVYPGASGVALSLHVHLPAQLSVEAAHQIAESAETLLRAEMPQLERVTIHTEPIMVLVP
ncbi:MAG: cation-efflux pump [Anaerolineae bacterium]|nr:cation-efflux pump [Anaerolineae bacterium]